MAATRAPHLAALALGGRADRLGYAFAGGYVAALNALVPARDRARTAALCATEAGGVHPRAIEARYVGGVVHGDKTFVTLADAADELYVLAREGERDGRPRLALVVVDARGPGVTLRPLPPAPFVPEIGHAAVRLDGAPAARLPGDGWDDYVRPFRTVEDAHVHLALLGWLIASARRWGALAEPALEEALALAAGLSAIAREDPSAPTTHLALAGAIGASARVLAALDEDAMPADDRARWRRDRPLLSVASKARAARRAKAWEPLQIPT
ncbi:MAG: acyl-CoA dehydrogenase family protein [Sandaracinaceae bacterium]|nr:acyl-CoA dehydrogenase family protein [Sandaracinaceae bacterium]